MNNLEKLKKRLYTKGESFEERERGDFSYESKRGGQYAGSAAEERERQNVSAWMPPQEQKKSSFGILKFIFAAAVLIFLASAGWFWYSFFYSPTTTLSKNIELEIRAPSVIDAGQLTSVSAFVVNQSGSSLELADLIFEFPNVVVSEDGTILKSKRISLGQIMPATSVNKTLNIALMGAYGETKKIKAVLEYRLADSNAIFAKPVEYEIKLARSAADVAIKLPKETHSRQEFSIDASVVSNAAVLGKNVFFQMTYPAGFQFVSASPSPSKGNNIWSLGDLVALQKRNISIKGIVEGQDMDEKVFNGAVGVLGENDSLIAYGSDLKNLTVKKSALDLVFFVQGKNLETAVVRSGESVRMVLQWVNNLPVPVRDAQIEVDIQGSGYDAQTINVAGGYYRASDRKLVWSPLTLSDLKAIEPGGNGSVSFGFTTSRGQNLGKNQLLKIDAKIFGSSVSESGVVVIGEGQVGEAIGAASQNIKISSDTQLATQVLRYSGEFQNIGPMPTKVGSETTYTVSFSVGNSLNDFSKVQAAVSLPPYVRWTGNVYPESEDVKFDDKDGIVVWNVGNVPAGVGINSPARKVSFQIGFTPSQNQVGESPNLLERIKLNGHNDFSGDDFSREYGDLDIALNADSQFKYGEGKVAP